MRLVTFMQYFSLFLCVSGHGRLIEPPSRTSAWRFGFGTPANYNDHETNCGGFERHWEKNEGRCGVCGDPWDQPVPRDGEHGGVYGVGVVVRTYQPGQTIRVVLDITANHLGFLQFKLCPSRPATQPCFDRNILRFPSGETRQELGPETGTHAFRVRQGC